jgi:hypothetical protein
LAGAFARRKEEFPRDALNPPGVGGNRFGEILGPIYVRETKPRRFGRKLLAQGKWFCARAASESIEDDAVVRIHPLVGRKLAKRMGARGVWRGIGQIAKQSQDFTLQFRHGVEIVRVRHCEFYALAHHLL